MLNVCPNCGEYRVDKIIQQNDKNDSIAICPICDHPNKFLQLPLFIVTGASGAGKSTIVLELSCLTKDVVVMETDILWDNRYNQPKTNYRDYREVWLRMAKILDTSKDTSYETAQKLHSWITCRYRPS